MKEESLEEHVKLIEGMRMPERLTADLDLSTENQSIVEKAVEEIKESGYAIVPSFLMCISNIFSMFIS